MSVSDFVVTDEHIDRNGHVRDSQYVAWASDARWESAVEAGMSPATVQEARLGPVILQLTIRYRHELMLGDTVRVETQHHFPGGKTMRSEQRLLRAEDGVPAADVEAVVGLMDLDARVLTDDIVEGWHRLVTDPARLGLPAES